MNWETSRIYDDTLMAVADGQAVVVNKGGTRSGKTWSVLQCCYYIATHQRGKVISIVGESIPFLKRGAIRDFQALLGETWNVDCWNATDKIYNFPHTGSSIEFFSADNEGKVHGSARDYLFVNECYYIPWEVYRQLAVRTRKAILLDYNPRSRFWVDDKVLGKDNVTLIHSTYKDNPHLTPMQVATIESNKADENWWRVYGLGETGTTEGLIYTNWVQCEEIPTDARLVARGLDFGFSQDPTAIVSVYMQGGDLWLNEECYLHGLTNDKIADILKALPQPQTSIVADSAELKSIVEIRNYGVRNIEPANKGADSVRNGIQIVQRHKLHVTQSSLNLIKELRNYSWQRDRISGEWRNEPNKSAHIDHALDAVRYVCLNKLAQRRHGTARATIGRQL